MNEKHKLHPSFRKMFVSAILASVATGVTYATPTDTNLPSEDSHEIVLSPQQSKVTVSGLIEDSMGTVIGVSIVEKGTSNGTITDMSGEFSLSVSSNATLVISYIGYQEQQIVVGNNRNFRILLKEDTHALEEVVVVGYGTQKKVNLSGSISTINVSELTESRPITNVSQALAGMAAGVTVTSSSNQPGNDNADIKVRGQGTLNSSSPLVIIDGVEAGINTVNPQDIETMTVLKDASSAAIYGSRAANGVILITTKQGKAGSLRMEYNGYVSFSSIRKTLTPVSNYADYMELVNEGLANSNQATIFSENSINTWRNDAGQNPLKYPNTDWIDETFQNSTATNHVVSMSGGSEKMRFYGSFGYSDTPGVMDNAGFTRYSGRVNLTADVKPWLTLGMQVNGYVSDMGPAAQYSSSGTITDDIFTYASATTPGMVFRAPDGRFGAVTNDEDDAQCNVNNPLARANRREGGIRKNNMRTRFSGTFKPFKGFSVTGSYSYELVDEQREWKPVTVEQWNFLTETMTYTNAGRTSIMNYNGKIERYFNDVVARYDVNLANDRLSVNTMVGASQELYRSKNFSATKYDLIDNSLGVINGATGDASANGSMSEWAMHSYFGRINLGWEDKYLLEFNLRSDASSRFLSDKRWGYFPSGSIAWRMDQESFMNRWTEKSLSALKLRASYGSLGNNSVGNYDAISSYSTSNYVLNSALATGLAQTAISNAALTWESTYVTNIGLDFGFFNNSLTGTLDYFHKRTEGILINLPAPSVHGSASIPKVNSATVVNKGFEATIGWQDKIADFTYGINANFSHIQNKVTKFKGTEMSGMQLSGANMIWEGHSINSQYVLIVDRILQTDEDMKLVQEIIDNAPINESTGQKRNPFAAFGTPQKGDFLYKDVNGDGIIDNTDKDIVSDGPNPKFTTGVNINLGWKGFDFSMLVQGSFGGKVYWQSAAYNTPTVRYGYQLNKEVCDGRWYEGRTDATYPRLLHYSDSRNQQVSDFYVQSTDFVKIRNMQLGYTLPKALVNGCGIERVRVYGSLENFFTFTGFKGFDPEVSGLNYPTMRQAVVGLNVTF
ncbi:MAG: SusC/RagA family TonB-linked outer membrane protein [Phocaeicola sp.]